MKTGRWITGIASAILFVFGILHGMGFVQLEALMSASSLKAPLGGIMRGAWLGFSVEQLALAAIAFVASGMQRGGSIVMLCGVTMGVTGLVMFHFMGPFPPVFAGMVIGLLFLAGGWMQMRQRA